MKLLITLNKDYIVDVEKDLIVVNQKPFKIEVGDSFVIVNGERFDVEKKIEKDRITLKIFGEEYSLKVREVFLEKKEVGKVVEGEGVVTAPMPGKIISVGVFEGQKVKTGDVLLVLEAMKMENEITSPKNGVVKKINVSKGKNVEKGDVLVVID